MVILPVRGQGAPVFVEGGGRLCHGTMASPSLSWVVSVILIGQVSSERRTRTVLFMPAALHLSSTSFVRSHKASYGPSVVYNICGRPCGHCGPTRCYPPFFRGWHGVVPALSPRGHHRGSRSADRLRCRCQPMDDRQQIETQHGQDRTPLDWVATQPVPIPGPGSSSATGCRHCRSARPGPAARGHHICWFKSWPSRVRCQCDVLPFVTSASTNTSFTRHWVDSDACPCFCNVYCNVLLAGSPKTVIDKLQRVMNAAARIVSGTWNYDRGLTQLLHAELHWLDVADRTSLTYKLGWMVYKCLHGQAPDYILVWAVHAGRSSRWTTASPFSQPQLARRPKVPAEHAGALNIQIWIAIYGAQKALLVGRNFVSGICKWKSNKCGETAFHHKTYVP